MSLKKIPRPSNLQTTYLSHYSRRWYSQKNISKPEVCFFRIYKLLNIPQLPAYRPGVAYPDATNLRHVMCVTDEMFTALICYAYLVHQKTVFLPNLLLLMCICVFLFIHIFQKLCILKIENSREKYFRLENIFFANPIA